MLALLKNTVIEAPTLTTRVILYTFPSKSSDELFTCVCFTSYGYLPGYYQHNSITPRTPASSLRLVRYHLSDHISCVPKQLSSRQNGEFRGYCVESLLCSLMLSSVHSTIIITNMLINQVGSYYIITNFHLILHRSQLAISHYLDDIIVITLDLSSGALVYHHYNGI